MRPPGLGITGRNLRLPSPDADGSGACSRAGQAPRYAARVIMASRCRRLRAALAAWAAMQPLTLEVPAPAGHRPAPWQAQAAQPTFYAVRGCQTSQRSSRPFRNLPACGALAATRRRVGVPPWHRPSASMPANSSSAHLRSAARQLSPALAIQTQLRDGTCDEPGMARLACYRAPVGRHHHKNSPWLGGRPSGCRLRGPSPGINRLELDVGRSRVGPERSSKPSVSLPGRRAGELSVRGIRPVRYRGSLSRG